MLDMKEINNKSLAKQAKKGKQIDIMMPAIEKAFDLLCDDVVKLSTKTDALKSKIGAHLA